MSSKNMALGGLLTALTLIVLYLTLIIPTNTLSLLTIASFMAPIALIRGSLKTAWLVYIGSAILSFIMLPLNVSLLYILFFGCYGIIKSFIEGLNQIVLEYFLKFAFFNVIFMISLTFFRSFISAQIFKNFIPTSLSIPPSLVLWGGAQVAFFIFDYALTLMVDSYYKYFSK